MIVNSASGKLLLSKRRNYISSQKLCDEERDVSSCRKAESQDNQIFKQTSSAHDSEGNKTLRISVRNC
jgi:hypothetical protein